MSCRPLLSLLALTLPTVLAAQHPGFLLSFSLLERSASGSGGTDLAWLWPNEIHQLEFAPGCVGTSTEKWAPRTAFHALAGDENGDVAYWRPGLFQHVDALVTTIGGPGGGANLRTVFWSPSQAMGTVVSGGNGLRPGDTGRIVRTSAGDGRVEYFLSREQVNQSLGLPLTTAVDVDAIAFAPSLGVFFSLDSDINVNTACGTFLLRDGDVVAIAPYDLTYTIDMRINTVATGSAVVVHTEAQMDAFVLNATVTNHFGGNVTSCWDLESLDIDWSAPLTWHPGCTGLAFQVPAFLFSTEMMTGASILTTANLGMIYNGPCGPMGTTWGNGMTTGAQTGLFPPNGFTSYSFVNALVTEPACRYVLEPRQPNLATPSPAGAVTIDIASPAPMNWVFLHFAPMGVGAVPASATFPPAFACFPDWYPPSWFYMMVATPNGFGSFPSPAIPPNFPCKLLLQSITVLNGNLELSTPMMFDVP